MEAYCLTLAGARPAGVQLAVSALEDEPMWPRVTEVAHPLNETGFGLDDLEVVIAVTGDGHGDELM